MLWLQQKRKKKSASFLFFVSESNIFILYPISLHYYINFQPSEEMLAKIGAYDRLMNENVELKMNLKTIETEKDRQRLEMERVCIIL